MGGGGLNPPNPPSGYATVSRYTEFGPDRLRFARLIPVRAYACMRDATEMWGYIM